MHGGQRPNLWEKPPKGFHSKRACRLSPDLFPLLELQARLVFLVDKLVAQECDYSQVGYISFTNLTLTKEVVVFKEKAMRGNPELSVIHSCLFLKSESSIIWL